MRGRLLIQYAPQLIYYKDADTADQPEGRVECSSGVWLCHSPLNDQTQHGNVLIQDLHSNVANLEAHMIGLYEDHEECEET